MLIALAHKQLLLSNLQTAGENWSASAQPQAAVLLTICPGTSLAYTLLTRRADTLPLHAGQISFPGGRRDTGDLSPESTALRECQEEIGLPPDSVELLGRLPQFTVSSGIVITPVVGWCNTVPALQPNPAEVAALIELPLALALNPASYQRGEKITGSHRREFLYLEHGQHYVWGATASILHSLATIFSSRRSD